MTIETVADGIPFLVGRISFGVVLALMGLNHFTGLGGMSGYAAAKGVPAPRLAVAASGVALAGGGLSIAFGIYPLVGAAVLALFFLAVTPVMHDFWTVEDPERRQSELTDFMKNVTLFGAALVFLAVADTAWPYALGVGL
ncbi:DoxX family protein [Halovivax limisalsi]|uniref:DoxX family protein n=1 Tax=Halovivax limisalsi TaxID=1453760 RepID=UPI001FFC88C5|nr:DoxX family protein [Halovivax limisalsi]